MSKKTQVQNENRVGTVGRFGISVTLEQLSFPENTQALQGLILYINHKLCRTTTWYSSKGKDHNQVDFILVPQVKSSINKTKTGRFPGADIGSNNDLFMTIFKLTLKTKHCHKSLRIYQIFMSCTQTTGRIPVATSHMSLFYAMYSMYINEHFSPLSTCSSYQYFFFLFYINIRFFISVLAGTTTWCKLVSPDQLGLSCVIDSH